MATSDAPLSVGRVALTVNDLDRVGDFYAAMLGLSPLDGDGETRRLGAGDRVLLELRRDPAARSAPREAGLYHTAFLLPDRADLGRWLRFAAEAGLRLDGASDHLVSEAIYLRDPEGNGIEVYADRPRDRWSVEAGQVRMDTIALDLQNLLAAGAGPWAGAPDGTVVGHVHLQVGDVGQADDFFTGPLGMARVSHMPSASFYSTGGYHHHIAGNVWHSRGAGQRPEGLTGLAELELLAVPERAAALPATLTDPWGNAIRISPLG